jgi:hypothetical protein
MMQQTWMQSEKLKKLNLKMCAVHGKLFSAKEGAQCKKCATAPPRKLCKRGHSRDAEVTRCSQCDKDRRETKLEAERARNKVATEERAARRAGLGLHS